MRSEIVRTAGEEARDVEARLQVLRYLRKKNPRIRGRKGEEWGDGVGEVGVEARSTLVSGGEFFRGLQPHALCTLSEGPERVGAQKAVRAGRRDQNGGAGRGGDNLQRGRALDLDRLTAKVRMGGVP